jgi:uncharacterized protein (DUF1684 family)
MPALSDAEIRDLLDWKRQIFELYARVRSEADPKGAWVEWVKTRDALFANHPSSAIPQGQRGSFQGLSYFPYDPSFRVLGRVEATDPEHFDIPTSGDSALGFTRFAAAHFELHDGSQRLDLYWLDGYGGGLFLPFKDTTAGSETYGGGRYLLDTVKGSDLGSRDGQMILDFNFAYNPSCSYDPRWVCPLAPAGSRLEVSVNAGEKHAPIEKGPPITAGPSG